MAALDLNAVRQTIEQRLFDELNGGSPRIDVVFENQTYASNPTRSWVQCLVAFGSSNYEADSLNVLSGTVFVNIFKEIGKGPGPALIIGKRIRDLYNRANVSGVYFDPPLGPLVLKDSVPQGFHQSQIRLTFDIFETV